MDGGEDGAQVYALLSVQYFSPVPFGLYNLAQRLCRWGILSRPKFVLTSWVDKQRET
jgi:hypothetical protein